MRWSERAARIRSVARHTARVRRRSSAARAAVVIADRSRAACSPSILAISPSITSPASVPLKAAQAACKRAVPMRGPARGRIARRRALSTPVRRAGDRTLSEMRRSAPRVRAHILSKLPSRLPARILLQGTVLLPELPPETRSRLWRLGRGERACARAASAIRIHATANAASGVFAQAEAPRGAVQQSIL